MTTRLLNQHWLSFSGEPITGRAPANTRIMNNVPMNQFQTAGVAHAYKLFTDAVQVTPSNSLVVHRTLQDGTRIHMVSNFGADEVKVWPAGIPDEDDSLPHGIGICFTSADGNPATGWTYKDANGNVFPHPYILRPIPKKRADGRIVGSGQWAITPVARLVGGKRLWVSADRRSWLSSFSSVVTQHPGATQTQIVNNRFYPSSELLTVRADWTATSKDRVQLGMSTDPAQLPFSDRGEYLFMGNDTVLLNTVSSTYPPFISRFKLAGESVPRKYAQVISIDSQAQSLSVHRAPYHVKQGLAKENANLAPQGSSVYLDLGLITVPITGTGQKLWYNTLSAHPDGKRLICMSYTRLPDNSVQQGTHIDVSIADDGAVTYKDGNLGVYIPDAWTPVGSVTWSGVRTMVPRFVEKQVAAYVCSTDGGATTPTSALHTERNLLLDTSVAINSSGSATTGSTSVWLNRYYYDLSGDTVIEKTTTVSSSSYDFTFARTYFTNGQTNPMVAATVETETYTVTSNCSYTSTQTAQLKSRSLVLNTLTSTLGQTVATTGNTMRGPSSATMNGNYAETQRDILFYDPINDFIIWLETTITGTVTGTVTGSKDSAYDVSSLASGTGTAKIVAKFKNVDVAFLATNIALNPPSSTVTCERVNASQQYGSDGTILPNGDTVIIIPSEGISMLGRFNTAAPVYTELPKTNTYKTAGMLPCNTGAFVNPQFYFVNDLQTITGEWKDLNVARTGPPQPKFNFVPDMGFYYTGADHPKDYIQVNYATDPVTLSVVVSLVFKGSLMPGKLNSDKVWLIAVDDTGARKLGSVIPVKKDATGNPLPIPDDAIIYEKASLQSLVSI